MRGAGRVAGIGRGRRRGLAASGGDMGSIVYKSHFYNVCIIYKNTSQVCIFKTQSLFTLKNKMPKLKIAFCVHQNAGKYHGRLSSIQVTETDMVFLFENMIIYDVLSALQFLLSLSPWLYSRCLFSYLLHYSSAVFIYLHICCFT